jgi:hypothetical protein
MKYMTAGAFVITALILALSLIVPACTQWVGDQRPETPEERACVERVQIQILEGTPRSLDGHDQDWDDAIKAANSVACKTCCKVRSYEWDIVSSQWTGKVKEIIQ